MSDLPPGWAWATLGDVLERIEAGRSFGVASRSAREGEWGIIRVSAMTWGEFRLDQNKAVPSGVEVNRDHEIRQGDILLSRANTEEYVGASVRVRGGVTNLLLSDKSLRLVPSAAVDPEFLVQLLGSSAVRSQISRLATGTKDSMRNISQAVLKRVEFPLPPLAEQRRMAMVIEGNLVGLNRAEDLVRTSTARSRQLARNLLGTLLGAPWPRHWRVSTVAEAGKVDLGRQRHPDWHTGSHPRPYLRVANVFEDRLDLSDVMEMDFPPDVFERFRLLPGDILLNEGQSPHLLGRPAMYRGQPEEIAFTNSLLRFRAGSRVLPEWALLIFRHYMHSGRFAREVRITTNIAHLSAGRFKSIEFPVPPIAEQQRVLDAAHRDMSYHSQLERSLKATDTQAQVLRKSLLAAAFRGELVDQDPNDEPADVLLARVHAERATTAPKKQPHTRKVTAQ